MQIETWKEIANQAKNDYTWESCTKESDRVKILFTNGADTLTVAFCEDLAIIRQYRNKYGHLNRDPSEGPAYEVILKGKSLAEEYWVHGKMLYAN